MQANTQQRMFDSLLQGSSFILSGPGVPSGETAVAGKHCVRGVLFRGEHACSITCFSFCLFLSVHPHTPIACGAGHAEPATPSPPRMHFSTPWHFRLTIFTLSSCTLPSQCRAHFFPPQQAKTTVGKSVLVLRNAARAACIEQQMWRGHVETADAKSSDPTWWSPCLLHLRQDSQLCHEHFPVFPTPL